MSVRKRVHVETLHQRVMSLMLAVFAVMMEAPDDVLLERFQGRLVDPLTGGESHCADDCFTQSRA